MQEKIKRIQEEDLSDIKDMIKNLKIDNKKVNNFKWLLLFRGLLLLAIAVMYIMDPMGTNKTLVIFLGISIFITGVTKIVNYFMTDELVSSSRMISGIFDILFGILILRNIELSFMTLTALVSIWIMMRGISQLGIAFELKRANIRRWWLVLISGILGILVGIVLFGNWELSIVYLTVYNTINLIYSGILSIILFFDIRKVQKRYFKN